jgi:divalent metal cation (Fe/Co/Zn/Cd) transporter
VKVGAGAGAAAAFGDDAGNRRPSGLRSCRVTDELGATRPERQVRLIRWGFTLEGITLGWNVVGVVVLAVAAVTARSVALGGFGLDSLIEIGASTVVIWELTGTGEHRQRLALRIIGAAFVLLAAYLAVQSTWVLATAHHPKTSPLGIAWTSATAVVMFSLAAGKARVGRLLGNPVIQAEGRVTMIDGLLATAVVVGLGLNAALGWWWADPLAGYVILFYGLREGAAAIRASRSSGHDDATHP